MRNKIPCSAERLSLLDPPMIQAVVDRNAFHIGNQYLSQNRVRIVEADDAQISSAVIGNSGLYEQTIRLKEGHLVSKCSCALPEEPMCRHCIAVLLEYHRWTQPRSGQQKKAKHSATPQPAEAPLNQDSAPVPNPASTTDLKLGEVMAFVEWLQSAIKALECEQPLPDSQKLGGDLAPWIQAIRNLEERRHDSEERRVNLESDMRTREAYVGRLTQQLQASMEEIKAAQTNSQQLQQELTACKVMLAQVSEVASEVGSYDSQLTSIASEMMSRGPQLNKLAHSFKEVSTALKALAKRAAIS
jgi:outer membrane murein-binding lipoprotein Lpp